MRYQTATIAIIAVPIFDCLDQEAGRYHQVTVFLDAESGLAKEVDLRWRPSIAYWSADNCYCFAFILLKEINRYLILSKFTILNL